ncbi:MAG: carbohydrate binding domain-containing protein [Clostridia bacterium]|nr:carbohydrate binding domain-containing protein [Clostridia bacterium]
MKRSARRILVLLLAVLMLWAAIPAAMAADATTNWIQNGDFESGNTGGWNTYQSTRMDTVSAKNGGYGLHVVGNGSWGGLGNQTVTGLTVGKVYRFSLWYKALSNGVNIQLCDGTTDKGTKLVYTYGTKTEWTRFAVEFEALSDTAFFTLVGAGNNVATEMYIDDIVLEEVVLGGNDADPNLKMIDTLMGDIKMQGRTAMVGGTLMLDFSISGVEFALSCQGDVYATFNARKISNSSANGGVYFTVVVDGVPRPRDYCRITSVGETKVKLADSLPAGRHTFAIYRQTEHSFGEVGICALSYDGDILDRPVDKDLYIEFIGDSISCGYGNLGNASQGNGDPLWSDGTRAYTYLTAKALDADWSNVSWSGLGCKYGYSSITMQDVYPAQRYNYNQIAQYDFVKQPDVIVLALGTNDNSKAPGSVQKREGLVEMLRLVRTKNPDVPIVWIYNMMTGGVNSMIEDIVEEFGGEKAGYYTCQLTRNTSGGGYHPNLVGQQTFADELTAFLLERGLCRVPAGNGGLLSDAGISRMEINEMHGGIGFQFEVKVDGVKMASDHRLSLTNATVDAYGDGTDYKLVGLGALLSNDVEVGTDPARMTMDNLSKNTVRVDARYLVGAKGDCARFTARVINVPHTCRDMTVYARPYYVFERDGRTVVTYGSIVEATYNDSPLFNDTTLQW